MDELRKYLGYAAKGIVSVPVVLAAAHAGMRYDEAVGDPRWLTEPEQFAEVESAAGQAMAGQAVFVWIWDKR